MSFPASRPATAEEGHRLMSRPASRPATAEEDHRRRATLSRQTSRERAAASERRRSSIRERGRLIVIEDVKALQRRRRAEKAVSKYPKSAVLALKAIFDEYDRDGSGDINRQELTFALQRRMQGAHRVETRSKTLAERQAEAGRVNGQPGDTKGIFLVDFSDTLFDALDANGDAKVEFGELLRIIYPLATPLEHRTMLSWVSPTKTADEEEEEYRLLEEQKRLASLRAMFSAFDRNKDGKVSLAEFRMAMLDHENWEEVDNLFDQYDANGNGEVDFEEFCAIVDPDPHAEPVEH